MRNGHGMKAGASLLAAVALWGAAAHAQPKGNPAMPCFRALATDPRFAAIKDKVALGGDLDEMHRMTKGTERASAQEAPVIAAWKDARADCHRLEKGYFATRDSGIQALAEEYFAALQAQIAELQAAKISYGEFDSRRLELYGTLQIRVEAIRRQILPPKPTPYQIKDNKRG